jgi:cytolysin-activating lysine-acyltransferase
VNRMDRPQNGHARDVSPGGSPKLNDAERRTQKILSEIDGLAAPAGWRDSGASHQRKGRPMGQSGNGNGGSKDGATSSETVFTSPAPEGAAKKVSEVLGEIVWLMSQSPLHKQFFISDIEWLVMTPVLLQQFRLFYDNDKPIGVAFWATVNEEVEERLKAGTTRLRPQDWKSGNALWVVEVIAPFGGAEEMVKDLKAKVFAGRELKFLATSAHGRQVAVLKRQS